MEAIIYGLYDPRNQQLRYVGKTNRPKGRLYYHCNDDRNTHKGRWIMQLKSLGLLPIMRVIERLPDDDNIWPERERYWIQRAKDCGCRLTNLDEGGLSGFKKHPDTIAKMREVTTGRIHSVETRSKMSLSHIGRVVSKETRLKISESNKVSLKAYHASLPPKPPEPPKPKYIPSLETRHKQRLAKLGKKQTPEAIEKSHSKLRGRTRSPEVRAKMSAAKRIGWARKKALQLGDQSIIQMSLAA